LGSGFIIDKKGIVITNNHVIQNAEEIIVKVNGKKEFKAKVLGADPLSDVAVIEIISEETFTPVKFGDSDKARIGDWVIAIGNPFGFGGTVTSGIISARNREIGLSRYEDYIQTDASINQGNSGGPLFNLNGEVIGINTAILGQSGSIGIGFAIPSNSASLVVNQLLKYGETKRGWLGVRIQEVTKEIAEVEQLDSQKGALVASVGKNSPADKAGIKPGDIILEFDGKDVDTMRTLPKIVALTEVGKNVIVKVWRNKKIISKKVLLGRLESSKEFASFKKKETPSEIKSLKITVRLLSEEDINKRQLPADTTGVVIVEIASDSPLNGHMQVNDVIVEVKKTKKGKKRKEKDNTNFKNVSIPKGISIDSIDLQRANFLCSLPKVIGQHPDTGKDITLNSGRFGPYLKCENKSARIETSEDIFTIGLNRAVTMIAEAKPGRISSSEIKHLGEHPEDKKPVRVMKGKLGPYIKYKSLNATIPEEKDPNEITMDDALILIEKRKEYDKNKKKKRK